MSDEGKNEPPAAPAIARHLPGRFPLLWILLPLLAAYLVAFAGAPPRPTTLVPIAAGSVVIAIAAAFRQWRARPASTIWAVAIVTGVFAAGLTWHAHACPPPPDRKGLPPREAVLSLRVDELFATRTEAASGIGTVTSAPVHLRGIEGARVQFRMKSGGAAPGVDLGAILVLRGVLESVPDEDGFARYLRRRGVSLTLSRAKSEAVERPASGFRQACTRARARVENALRAGTDAQGAARMQALMLGRTALLPKEEQADFRRSGATHLFAISGLHITGIAAGLLWATRRLRVPDAAATPAVLGALWLYVQMAGAPPSAMRAWIMSAALFGAGAFNRGARPAAGLIFAATITLITDPGALRDPGFQLSYLVVGAILLYAVPAARALEATWHPWRFTPPDALGWWRRKVVAARAQAFGALATTWAATLAGAPLVAALFGNAAPIGLVANLALVPLSAPPVILGFIASALGATGLPEAAAPFTACGALFMKALARGAHLAAAVPGGAWTTGPSPDWAPALAGGAILAALLALPPAPDKSPWRYAALPVAAMTAMALCFA